MGEFSSRDAIPFCCDLIGCESMIFKENPQDLPSGSQVAGRQFGFNGGLDALKGQDEGPSRELAEGDLLPVSLQKPLHHRINVLPYRLRDERRNHLGFWWEQTGQKIEQMPKGGFCTAAVDSILLNLGQSKPARTGAVPGFFASA